MRLSSRQVDRNVKLQLSMTSMIDVVFLLLVFFLVTTTFVPPEKHLRPAIKVNRESNSSAKVDLEPAIVDIVREGDSFVYRLGAITSTDIEEIRKVLDSFENKGDGAFVRTSGEAPFEMAAFAINACKNTGFFVVSYIPLD